MYHFPTVAIGGHWCSYWSLPATDIGVLISECFAFCPFSFHLYAEQMPYAVSSHSLQCVKVKPLLLYDITHSDSFCLGCLQEKDGKIEPYMLLKVHRLAFHSRCNAGFGLLNTFFQLPIISPNKTAADGMISFSLLVFLFRKTCFKCNKRALMKWNVWSSK